MKRIVTGLLAVVLILSLCACNSGGAQKGDNPVPDKAQSVVSINRTSSAASSKDYSQYQKMAKAIAEKEDEWAAADKMNESGISGFFATGYMFFDIDLDGNKELLVQLGTTETLHCETIVYRIDGEGQLSEIEKADSLSFSAENLTLWTDEEGATFYLNHYSKKSDKGTQEVWNKLIFDDGMLKERSLFYIDYIEQTVSSAPTSSNPSSSAPTSSAPTSSAPSSIAPQTESTTEYYIAGNDKPVSKEDFDKAFNEFRGKLTQSNVKTEFIKSTEWAMYTAAQKENALFNELKK